MKTRAETLLTKFEKHKGLLFKNKTFIGICFFVIHPF